MVEGQFQRPVAWLPCRLARVVPTMDYGLSGPHDACVGQGDGASPRVAPGFREEPDRVDSTGDLEAGLLAELAAGSVLGVLVHLEEAAGDRPLAREGIAPPADKEHPERRLDQGEDQEVDRDLRARMVVTVRAWHGMASCGTMACT